MLVQQISSEYGGHFEVNRWLYLGREVITRISCHQKGGITGGISVRKRGNKWFDFTNILYYLIIWTNTCISFSLLFTMVLIWKINICVFHPNAGSKKRNPMSKWEKLDIFALIYTSDLLFFLATCSSCKKINKIISNVSC